MKKSRALMSAATLAAVCVVGAGLSGFVAADTAEVNAVSAVAAVQKVAPDAVSDVATLVKPDSNTAVQAKGPKGDTVQVPKDASSGVQVAWAVTGAVAAAGISQSCKGF